MMQHPRLAVSAIAATGFLSLLLASPVHAVPCGAYAAVGGIKTGSTDLGNSAATCRNGAAGDANNSVSDLNDGAFFGSSNWLELDKADSGEYGDSNFWTFSGPAKPAGAISGSFSLKAGLWNLYSKLVVVLKDGGSTTNKDIKWSAYLLPVDVYGPYSWSYDNRKALSHASIYGVEGRRPPVTVPEPSALALFGAGLAAATAAMLRRRARQS